MWAAWGNRTADAGSPGWPQEAVVMSPRQEGAGEGVVTWTRKERVLGQDCQRAGAIQPALHNLTASPPLPPAPSGLPMGNATGGQRREPCDRVPNRSVSWAESWVEKGREGI